MDLPEIFKAISAGDIFLIVICIMSLVQITPIKINPWTFIATRLGRAINQEVIHKVEAVQNDLANVHAEIDKIRQESEERQADDTRNRILRFDDELRVDVKHSRELFDQILLDVDFYESYCNAHEYYKNSKAVSAINHIRHIYDVVKETNDFI